MKRILSVLATLTLLTGCASTKIESASFGTAHKFITSGYYQTPHGGSADTTTPKRPTFKETNLSKETNPYFKLRLARLESDEHHLEFYYEYSSQKEKSIVSEPFESMGQEFKLGENLTVERDLPKIRLRYFNDEFKQTFLDDRLKIKPFIGLYWYKNHLTIKSHTTQTEQTRSYSRGSLTIGAVVNYDLLRIENTAFLARVDLSSALKSGYSAKAGLVLNRKINNKINLFLEASYFARLQKDSQDDDLGGASNQSEERGRELAIRITIRN